MYASLCPNCVTKKTTLVQQKNYQMFLSIATPMTKLLSITTLCILYFFCVRRIFSRLYVQYDYMPFYYHHCVKISYLCQAIISYSLHFKFCGSGESQLGKKNYIQFICGSVYFFQIHAIFQYLFLPAAHLKR